jgi:DNA-binding NarL/FixJ family response regulator
MTKSVIVSVNPADQADLSDAVHAGASGYLPKESGAAELRLAIETVAHGGSFFGPAVSDSVSRNGIGAGDGETHLSRTLTRRQREILRKIALGETTKSIARDLGISKKTVETHRAALMERLDIYHVAGLVRYAIKNGLTTLDE